VHLIKIKVQRTTDQHWTISRHFQATLSTSGFGHSLPKWVVQATSALRSNPPPYLRCGMFWSGRLSSFQLLPVEHRVGLISLTLPQGLIDVTASALNIEPRAGPRAGYWS
jgi:hypothetical protein